MDAFNDDEVFRDFATTHKGYFNLIYVKDYRESKVNTMNNHNPVNSLLFSDYESAKIDNKFIDYTLNNKATTFGELFNIEVHI